MSRELTPPGRRLFYALPIPASLRTHLGQIGQPYRNTELAVSWQEKKLMHLTLVFLGEQPDGRVDELNDILAEAGKQTDPFTLELEALGAFPSFGHPRVLWMGVRTSPPLIRLQSRLLASLDGAGIVTDHRDFHPHITLGRCPHELSGSQRRQVQAVLSRPVTLPDPASWEVDRIHLYESHTDAHGLHYTPIGGVMLPGA